MAMLTAETHLAVTNILSSLSPASFPGCHIHGGHGLATWCLKQLESMAFLPISGSLWMENDGQIQNIQGILVVHPSREGPIYVGKTMVTIPQITIGCMVTIAKWVVYRCFAHTTRVGELHLYLLVWSERMLFKPHSF